MKQTRNFASLRLRLGDVLQAIRGFDFRKADIQKVRSIIYLGFKADLECDAASGGHRKAAPKLHARNIGQQIRHSVSHIIGNHRGRKTALKEASSG